MKSIVLQSLVPVVLVAASALVGCAHERPAMANAPTTGMTETTSTQVAAAPGPKNLGMSAGLIAACKIDFNNVSTAPKFDFADSTLAADERGTLDQVAKCVTTGPMKGHALTLVGRADPRGEQEYNMVLGGNRAASVQAYLLADGVSSGAVTTTSRGKLDATGTDDAGWQLDRRVDVDLK